MVSGRGDVGGGTQLCGSSTVSQCEEEQGEEAGRHQAPRYLRCRAGKAEPELTFERRHEQNGPKHFRDAKGSGSTAEDQVRRSCLPPMETYVRPTATFNLRYLSTGASTIHRPPLPRGALSYSGPAGLDRGQRSED